MAAFLGISVWITLATVFPGLITIALLYGAALIIDPGLLASEASGPLSGWAYPGIAVTIMVLTQALGILLESVLVGGRFLGPELDPIRVPAGVDPCGEQLIKLRPYDEYDGLYLLLAELRTDEDTQGHLQRATAQFFLTNNSLVSYSAALVFAAVLTAGADSAHQGRGIFYVAALVAGLLVSYRVARIRFRVMGKVLWAARRRRINDSTERRATDSPPTTENRVGRPAGGNEPVPLRLTRPSPGA